MADPNNTAIIAGVFALAGTVLGGLITLGVEAARRHWTLSDRRYDRTKDILDRRCEQAEAYAQAVTEDFRRLMHDAEAILLVSDPLDALQREQARREWKDHLHTRVFALGPSIRALGDEDLKKPWDLMMKAMDRLHRIYLQVCDYRLGGGKKLDQHKTISSLNRSWLDFSKHLGGFYARIDQIRSARLE
jgi:hypothetical protein